MYTCTMSGNQMGRRWLTSRRVILLGIVIAVCRLSWTTLYSLFHVEQDRYHGGFPDSADLKADQFLRRPQGCVMADNKSCISQKSGDAYLGKGLYAHGDSFYLDGRPFRIYSGSFHYFRTQPSDWGDRLLKMKAAGLNTVMTYVPWNLHEPIKDRYVFDGRWDIASFIRQAQQVGLKVIVRPGPYICAEWEFGGLPSWLLRDPDMKLRTSYGSFLHHAEEYLGKLLSVLTPLTYKRGGPIIAFQVENEYGSYGTDKVYLKFLVDQVKKFNIEELLFTSDGTKPEQLSNGTIPGVLVTANFKDNQKQHLLELKKFQPDKPLMVTEFWSGWFDHWGESHHNMTNVDFHQYLSAILDMGASVNFYMFVGGTNFEFWNGANMDKDLKVFLPTITSYDYDAPISEDGALTEKFFITQKLLAKYSLSPEEPIRIVDEVARQAYGELDMEHWLPYKTLTDIAQDAVMSRYGEEIGREHPVSMEFLDIVNNCGQNFGFLLYRTEILTEEVHTVKVFGDIRDRAQVILNSEELATLYRNEKYPVIKLPVVPALEHGMSNLDVLVENMGRVNFKSLNSEHKGLVGTLIMDDEYLTSWTHIPMDFDEEFVDTIVQQDVWLNYVTEAEQAQTGISMKGPALFKTHLSLDTYPKDTHLDMFGWTKGIVIVNGYNIGRYWRVGPQRTLYVPGSLLVQGRNVILVFELHRPSDTITFTDAPMLNHKW